jgi:hypothetical protein
MTDHVAGPNASATSRSRVAELQRQARVDYAKGQAQRATAHHGLSYAALATAAALPSRPDPDDLDVAIRVAQDLLDSDQLLSLREALRLLLRALGAEPADHPDVKPWPSPEVLRLRMQMRAANYNPDLPHKVRALACVATIDTEYLAAVLTGRAPLDHRIRPENLARVLGVDTIGTDKALPARCPAAHPEDPTPCGGPVVVTVLDATNAGADGCEHHAARMLASLDGAYPIALPHAPAGTATRVFKAADGIRPFPWLTGAPRTRPEQLSRAEIRERGEGR